MDDAIALYRELLTRQPLDHDNRVSLARVLSWKKQLPRRGKNLNGCFTMSRRCRGLAGLGICCCGTGNVSRRFRTTNGQSRLPGMKRWRHGCGP